MTRVNKKLPTEKPQARSQKSPRQRVPAEVRRQLIVEAARRMFSLRGDVGSTTTRMIAKEAGISEAIIYKHFSSKEELFAEAIVAPLRASISTLVESIITLDPDITDEELRFGNQIFIRKLIKALSDSIPNIGLVLFGHRESAHAFYSKYWKVLIDEFAKAFDNWYDRVKVRNYPDSQVAARMIVGVSLMYAIDERLSKSKSTELREKSALIAGMLYDGVFQRRKRGPERNSI